jgi:hypothetical protein
VLCPVSYNTTALLAVCFMLVSCLSYTSTLKMEATCSSETVVDFRQITWCNIPEDRTLQSNRMTSVLCPLNIL